MVQPRDYPKLAEMLLESHKTGRPIETLDLYDKWIIYKNYGFDREIYRYRVQPAPPQPKFRPLNHDELMDLVRRGVVVHAVSRQGTDVFGRVSLASGIGFGVAGLVIDTTTLRNALTGELLQVEIKD